MKPDRVKKLKAIAQKAIGEAFDEIIAEAKELNKALKAKRKK